MNNITKLYKHEDFSISEIAEGYGISIEEVKSTLKISGIELKERRKNNYPKDRKKGVYRNTERFRLLHSFSFERLRETWIENGCYKSAEILNTSPAVIQHLAREYGWKRPLPEHLVKAFHAGNWKLGENYYLEEGEEND